MNRMNKKRSVLGAGYADHTTRVLREVLRRRDEHGELLATACADITNDGDLREMYLAFTDTALYFFVGKARGEMLFSGAGLPKNPLTAADITEVHTYPLATLDDPKIINEVVGGLLTVTVNGEETWLCRFSGARMREMTRFVRLLSERLDALNGRAPKSDDEDGRSEGRGRRPMGPPPGDDAPACCPKCGMPYPEAGRQVCPRCMDKGTVFMRVLKCFTAFKGRVTVMLLCVLLSGVISALWPYLSGTVYYAVVGRDEELAASLGMGGHFGLLLGLLVLCMAGVRLLGQITGIIHGRTTAHMVPAVVCRLKDAVFESLQRLSIGFFNRRQTGSLMQRVNNDANEVTGFFIDGLPYLLSNGAMVLLSAVVMFRLDWRLALLALCLLPPLFFISYKLMPRMWHAHGRRARTARGLYSVLNDNFTGARVVKAFGREESENTRFDRANNRLRDAEINIVKYRNIYNAAYSVGRELPVLLVWGAGAFLILRTGGGFSFGKLVTFVNYLTLLQGPMDFFSFVFQWWTDSMNSAQRVFEIIDAVPDVAERDNALHLDLKGEIEMRDVSFGYEPNKPVLEHIDLDVKPGEMLGVVGRSGAGKSTLVNLISRLYDPDSGEVLLDGVNVKDIAFSSLRGAIAMVSQETYIFMGTIADNIAYARPDATREEIVQAAMAASAHRFICRLPDGYDTVIGTGGRQLSGGERQRLSIARAILADPKILVLDEATASVDTETERAIQDSLDQLVKGRTTISIAHRLSTLRNADRLIVLDNGRVAERGTHDELIRQKGVYYKLYQLQSKALAMRSIGE